MNKMTINVMIVSDPSPLQPGTMEKRKEDTGRPGPPAVEHLWAFSCELSRGRSISSMACNKKNPVVHTHAAAAV